MVTRVVVIVSRVVVMVTRLVGMVTRVVGMVRLVVGMITRVAHTRVGSGARLLATVVVGHVTSLLLASCPLLLVDCVDCDGLEGVPCLGG